MTEEPEAGGYQEEAAQAQELVVQPAAQPVESVSLTARAAVYAAVEREKAAIRTRYELAHSYPRDPEAIKAAILAELEDPELAVGAIYEKPVGKDRQGNAISVTGPSIRLAEAIFRATDHMDADVAIVEESPEERRVVVSVTDYQTGKRRSQDFSLKKTVERSNPAGRAVLSARQNTYGKTVYRVVATEDENLITQAAFAAKVRRNLIVELTPRATLNAALQKAAQVSKRNKAKPKTLFEAFAEIGVTREQIARTFAVDLSQPRKIPAATLEQLRRIHTAIMDGETTWAEVEKAAAAVRGPVGVASAGAAAREALGIPEEAKGE